MNERSAARPHFAPVLVATRRGRFGFLFGLTLLALLSQASGVLASPAPPCSDSPECHKQPPPTVLIGPEISVGRAIVGQTVTASQGIWSNEPIAYSFQWVRCEPGYARYCNPIAGAVGITYVLSEADLGDKIGVDVSASNAAGTGGPAESDFTAPVSPGPYETSLRALANISVHVRDFLLGPTSAPASLGIAFRSKAVGRQFVPNLERIDIEVSRDLVFRTADLPSCPESTLFLQPSRSRVTCAGSLVGQGRVISEVTLPGKQPATLHGHLLAFFSSERGHRAILAQVTGNSALPLTYVIPFRFGKAHGAYGASLYANKSRMTGIKGECKSGYPNCFDTYGFEGIYGHIAVFELFLTRSPATPDEAPQSWQRTVVGVVTMPT